jgi:hypothetical protein
MANAAASIYSKMVSPALLLAIKLRNMACIPFWLYQPD